MHIASCTDLKEKSPLFVKVSPEKSGIHFVNQIDENDTLNVIDYAYLYNGSGLGVGDFNNDGLDDLFFAGNMVANQLYINRGNFSFQEVSEIAGITGNRWCTGVTIVDINDDGWMDVYVSVANKFNREASRNLLYINQGSNADGLPIFEERAAAYGLDDAGYSTQAAFFDYDLDGDLDMYLLTNGMEVFNHNNTRPKKVNGEGISNDLLYRNEGISTKGHPIFKDVSREANILKEGYGLGITINDFDQDGWPDIYAANDFVTNDLMWMNQGDGTFVDKAPEYLKHQTHNGMGTDVADYNNDGMVDIIVLDMLPEDNQRQKITLSNPNYDKFLMTLQLGYTPQYVRNTLQLNNGLTPDGNLSFSEIGQLAGIHNTDWSWSSLFADYDNDGLRDLLVTNGYVRDVTDLDYIMYQSSVNHFGSTASRTDREKEITSRLKSVKVPNYIYRNRGDLSFEDKSEAWGIKEPSFSNGTVFTDLDNDGDLDLVMNNINDPAFLYENTAEKLNRHYLSIRLEGPDNNRRGLGSKVTIWHNGKQQYHYHTVYRGYKSTIDANVHFGLGDCQKIDSLLVSWPDGKKEFIRNIPADQLLKVSYGDATEIKLTEPKNPSPLLKRSALKIPYKHLENDFIDFDFQPLLARMYSQDGPALAVGDINADGLDDIFVGGAKGYAGKLLIQQHNGHFSERPIQDAVNSEDMGALFFDADKDGDLDLYVVSGGNEFYEGNEAYFDRFYRNDGLGNFKRDNKAIPDFQSSGSCVTAADYDRDGDLDLFVGGRLRPHNYPLPPSSYILENKDGIFTDVTSSVAPALKKMGMVTSALWTDYDQDGSVDLLLAGEWMPLTFLHNEKNQFVNRSAETGLVNTSGWWNSLISQDFDLDGDLDYVAGNVGLNTKYKASAEEPVTMYVKDFDNNGTIDPIMSRYILGQEYPDPSLDALKKQIVDMRRRFPLYEIYSQARFPDVFNEHDLEGALVLKSKEMQSSYIENLGNGKFQMRDLPLRAQFGPIFGMIADDINRDGNPDLIAIGNSYATESQTGRYDAGTGYVFLGNGKGGFIPQSIQESGFFVDTDAKAAVSLLGPDQNKHFLFSSNKDSLKAYVLQNTIQDKMIITVHADEFHTLVELKDGTSYVQEFYHGQGFMSQSGRHLCLDKSKVSKVTIFDYQGGSRQILPEENLSLKY